MSFSKEFRQTTVEKVLSGSDVQTISKESGVSKYTIYNWIKDHQRGGKPLTGPSYLAIQEKQTLLLESRGIPESNLGEWLRKNGLHSDHLEKWKKEIDQAMKQNNDDTSKIKKLEKENVGLKKDLQEKEKALAEVTALLALKKKLSYLFEDEEK